MSRPIQATAKVRRLERQLVSLRREAVELRNSAAAGDAQMLNSFQTLVQSIAPTSPTNDFGSVIFNTGYNIVTLQYMALGYLYKSEGIIQAAIDMPVQDGFRGGIELISQEEQMDKDDIKRLDDDLSQSSFFKTIKTGLSWARLYGGGAIIVDNGENPEKPMTMQSVANRPLKFISCHRWELTNAERYPVGGFYTFYGQKVHATRVKTFSGKEAPYPINTILQGWGMSEVEHIVQPLNIFLRTQNVVYDLLKEAKVDVFRFSNFASQLSSNKGTAQLYNRVNTANQLKATNNALVMDIEDEYEQKQLTYAGLAEIWKENRIGLSCNLRIPMTKLFGISASGFASGEDDIENYCGMVESEVRDEAKPLLHHLLQLKCLSLFGDTYDLMFKYYPMRTMTAVEEEAVKTSKHTRWMSLAQGGYLTGEEFMGLEQKEGLVPIESEVSQGAEPEPVMAMTGEGDQDEEDTRGEQ